MLICHEALRRSHPVNDFNAILVELPQFVSSNVCSAFSLVSSYTVQPSYIISANVGDARVTSGCLLTLTQLAFVQPVATNIPVLKLFVEFICTHVFLHQPTSALYLNIIIKEINQRDCPLS